jgi:hypothetical protein
MLSPGHGRPTPKLDRVRELEDLAQTVTPIAFTTAVFASTPVLLDDPAILTVEAAHSTGVAGETAVETVANSTIEAVDSSIDPAAAANRPPQEG